MQLGNTNLYPRSTQTNGNWNTVSSSDWTSGFFPGCLWYVYEQTGDPNFKKWAQEWTAGITPQQFNTNTDDIGFMINASFGNGYRITGDTTYRSVVLRGARSLTNRFNHVVGCLADDQLLAPPNFEVIIDTMLNLELLYFATDINGNTNFSVKSFSHAQRAMTNQIRADNSTFQKVIYSTVNGKVLSQGTRGGYSDTSVWARGQAWAIYGFTMAYRETGFLPFLNAAGRVSDYYLTSVPSDFVPYWDFGAPDIPDAPRDSSSAAITLSALVELSQLATNMQDSAAFWSGAHDILESLGSTNYLADGTTNSGILLHATGEPPQFPSPEVDVALIYGDYYFLEALRRYTEVYGRNTVTYTPDPGFMGTDTFACQVCDSGGNCSTAIVTVVVLDPNTAPTFNIEASLSSVTWQPIISFFAASNHLYEVDYAESLTPPQIWNVLASNLIGGSSTISVADNNSATTRFYRVKAE